MAMLRQVSLPHPRPTIYGRFSQSFFLKDN